MNHIYEREAIKMGTRVLSRAVENDVLDSCIVPIDVSKYFHEAMIFGPGGQVLEDPFEIDIYQNGFKQLLELVRKTQIDTGKRVVFALEPTSFYHETMLEELSALGHDVRLISPEITAKVRNLDYDHIKTDLIDIKALNKAILLGKGMSPRKLSQEIKKLRIITRQRFARTKVIKTIKIQIANHMDILWPGFVNRYDRSKGLIWNMWESQMAWAIMQICPNPAKVAKMSEAQLIEMLQNHKVRGIGPKRAKRIIDHAKTTFHKSQYLMEIEQNLKQDIKLLHHLNTIVADLESKAVKLLPEEAKYLLSIKGISPFYAAAFIAEIGGEMQQFRTYKQIIRYTGLNVSIKQSGMFKQQNSHITKSGNKYLRYIVMMMAKNISRCNPDFNKHYLKFRERGYNHHKSLGCVATKLLKILFVMLTRKEGFDSAKFRQEK